jgi:hypothetical protein
VQRHQKSYVITDPREALLLLDHDPDDRATRRLVSIQNRTFIEVTIHAGQSGAPHIRVIYPITYETAVAMANNGWLHPVSSTRQTEWGISALGCTAIRRSVLAELKTELLDQLLPSEPGKDELAVFQADFDDYRLIDEQVRAEPRFVRHLQSRLVIQLIAAGCLTSDKPQRGLPPQTFRATAAALASLSCNG